ncbi:MAG: signal recognition particle-docking protein FtsY [Rickettsiales bacterium TMED254]|nr:signal recognition particle-docking protein FtsY [Rickettsiales bacterium]RPF75726.1 MAG: signal recognition particle-docking protein FtsY [Rickettsiales bacterium TMED254]
MVFNWVKNLKNGLTKSTNKIGNGIKNIFQSKPVDDSTLKELEELLITSDIGVSFSSEIIQKISKMKFIDSSVESVKQSIDDSIIKILKPLEKEIVIKKKPHVFLVVGVNGVGKTATVGKLAYKFSNKNLKVGVVAADTFRAAAVEQLEIWSKKTGSIFFSAKNNSDPASLAYSSYLEAKEKNLDLLIVDTAGRLHNKTNLMDELSKLIRVLSKLEKGSPHEIILVLDGNTGQNSIKQAQVFKDICDINSLIVTKLDGTAKGGVVIPIGQTLKIPIIFIGVGEKKDDLIDFRAKEFSKTLLDM